MLEAVDFALWGRHRHRTEDEWINDHESIGEVQLELDDGISIIRRRERGKRTTLWYMGPENKHGAMQDEAQKLIGQLVGLDQEDFLATCYFKQRQMARLVLTEPSKRMETVSAWMRLGPLERCEDKVAAEASVLGEQVDRLDAQLTSLDEMEKHALDGMTCEQMQELLDGHADVLEKRRGQFAVIQEQITTNARLISAHGKVQDFDQLVAEGKKLRAEIGKVDGTNLVVAAQTAKALEIEQAQRTRMAKSQVDEKRGIAQGQFDGVCPVAGIDCPAKDQINKDRKRGLKLFDEAKKAHEEVQHDYNTASAAEGKARAELGEFERKADRLHAMREQAARMEDDVELARRNGEPEDPQVLKLRHDDAARRLDEVMGTEKTMRVRLDQLDGIVQRRETINKQLGEIRARLAVYREAAVIFGKQGAQRRVAEGALAEIEEGANDILRETEIDLEVGIQWSREGSGLARACDGCGASFPLSARVKTCSRCKAPRGKNIINKLEIVLSDESGAAEDLAGVAVQLAASSWLRGDRGSSWGVAMMDEPFQSLDRAHRRAFALKLPGMLHGSGLEQAFVISHTADTVDAMPGRIEIVRQGDSSRVLVTA